ncbi:ubiquitin-conjugating enzyme E2 T-like [Fopius arisanus]|uniref:Ubiquitin-conjugating enzyme E2 T-like n=1 Tax=Fopius arisanus TaxID=64838 RepID=A0A9R1U1K8_9HYME|nr:PREDICTED: ubiquitin-conjugating enzyme E2 T-like [Fopius arisanus]XP_011304223.1 PREDICTED: ubiquitin-conjugating enzyme E2 T-like [Fopius arisanus]
MQVAERRLKRELSKLMAKPPEGISCYQKDERMNVLIATISGPRGSPYEGGLFNLEVEVDAHYPFHPPKMKFITSVYHPNIDTGGRICMDLLKIPKDDSGGWNPTITLESLFVAVQLLLENPNPDDPLMPDIANEYRLNKLVFEEKARRFTATHARNNQ